MLLVIFHSRVDIWQWVLRNFLVQTFVHRCSEFGDAKTSHLHVTNKQTSVVVSSVYLLITSKKCFVLIQSLEQCRRNNTKKLLKLIFSATYYSMINWQTIQVTKPPATKKKKKIYPQKISPDSPL